MTRGKVEILECLTLVHKDVVEAHVLKVKDIFIAPDSGIGNFEAHLQILLASFQSLQHTLGQRPVFRYGFQIIFQVFQFLFQYFLLHAW